jgi:hypothetical protein
MTPGCAQLHRRESAAAKDTRSSVTLVNPMSEQQIVELTGGPNDMGRELGGMSADPEQSRISRPLRVQF